MELYPKWMLHSGKSIYKWMRTGNTPMTPPDPGVATWQATSAGAGAAAWRRSKMAGFSYVFLA